jgi:hypothetical protein
LGYTFDVNCISIQNTKTAWCYKQGNEFITFAAGEKLLLADTSLQSKALSTHLHGCERYHAKCNTGPTGAENWAKDQLLLQRIRNNMTNAHNAEKEALSRNRIRAGLLQTGGCRSPRRASGALLIFL